MKRRDFLKTAAAAAAPPVSRASSAEGKPRNILLLLSDQHKHRAMGIDGDPVARTPHLDGLARSGMHFDSAYCSNPICAPSRASLLTGLYTHNHGVIDNRNAWPFERKTIAHALGSAGYMSALIGKMHFIDAQTHGFDYRLDFNDWLQYLGPKASYFASEFRGPDSGSGLPQIDDLWRDYGDPWLTTRDERRRYGELPEHDHFEAFVARESVRFLRNHGTKRPFFLIASFLKPHAPWTPAGRFATMFRPEDMQVPATWGKVDPKKVSRDTAERIERYARNINTGEAVKRRIALYHGTLSEMDHAAGTVLRALDELGLSEDTTVIYTSDHGEMLGEHGLWQKFVFYDPSAAVPLIVRAPGITRPGTRYAGPVSQVQLFPTWCEMAGVPAPPGLDGGSMVACLREPGRTSSTPVFAEFDLGTNRAKYMIRHGRYKYSYYVNGESELYDMERDPQEMANLAHLSEYAGEAQRLKAMLFAWHKPAELPASN
jgi:choline-sulfatase